LDDAMAALAYLKSLPEVDVQRFAVAGHYFVAERDTTVRAAHAFSPAALAGNGSPELCARLPAAIDRISVPVLLLRTKTAIHWPANQGHG
jgi:hypothetical protein